MSSSPEKKKEKKLEEELPSTPQPNPTPSLPDELLTSCIARLSRLYYPTLSLVSKSFRSLLASPELYKARSLSFRTESCLYLCLESSSDSRWFTLCRKPDKTETEDDKKSTSYALCKLPSLHSPPAVFSGLVSVGSDIYNIRSSSNVSVLDCRFHTWRKAPSLPVELMALSACAVDEKIYPHVATDDGVVCYNSQEGKWELGEAKMGSFRFSDSYCEVENVLYSVYDGMLRWYDGEVNVWRSLEGLVGLPKFLPGVSVRFGEKKILCAEIALERRGVWEIWGGVEWIDHVLTVPIGYYIVKALTAMV
ncbi:BnaA01g36490D [Brassica napus]|uniref:BnaA01g36490D protein n=1 Tax=Brassica napus TaxID=3708 RepID=A0A078JTF1_BRANA|nr:BnaA01g36490D [Brassica napus]